MDMIHTTERSKSLLQLHQTGVAILDSVFQLTPYMREPAPERAEEFCARFSVPASERPAAMQSLKLADAVAAKLSGEMPEGRPAPIRATRRLEGLEDQTDEMMRAASGGSPPSRSPGPNRRAAGGPRAGSGKQHRSASQTPRRLNRAAAPASGDAVQRVRSWDTRGTPTPRTSPI